MKKTMCLLLASAVLFALSGCGGGADKTQTSPETNSPPIVIQTGAVPSNSMTIDELIKYTNATLADDFKLNIDNAEIIDIEASPDDDEILYIFTTAEVETVLFADRQTKCFVGAYFRMLLDDDISRYFLESYVGVFLSVLEPREYAKMLEAVVPVEEDELYEEERSSGEVWTVVYQNDLVNILPLQ